MPFSLAQIAVLITYAVNSDTQYIALNCNSNIIGSKFDTDIENRSSSALNTWRYLFLYRNALTVCRKTRFVQTAIDKTGGSECKIFRKIDQIFHDPWRRYSHDRWDGQDSYSFPYQTYELLSMLRIRKQFSLILHPMVARDEFHFLRSPQNTFQLIGWRYLSAEKALN